MGNARLVAIAVLGILLGYGLWNRALGYPDSTPKFAFKITAALAVVALFVWLLVLIIENVEPFWLALVLALVLAIAGLLVAKRFERWDTQRVARTLEERD